MKRLTIPVLIQNLQDLITFDPDCANVSIQVRNDRGSIYFDFPCYPTEKNPFERNYTLLIYEALPPSGKD